MEKFVVLNWKTTGPGLFSYAPYDRGYLGIDYTTGCDGRWAESIGLTLAPLITNVSLDQTGDTPANANCLALSGTMHATEKYILWGRGTKMSIQDASDMALTSDGTETAIAAPTSMLYTKNAAGTEEISVGQAAATYRVVSSFGTGIATTHTACNEAITNRIMAHGAVENVVAGLGGQVVRQNELAGSVGMDASAWATRATLTGQELTMTGYAVLSGGAEIIGTSQGPFYFDNRFQNFRQMFLSLPQDSNNCVNMGESQFLDVICPLPNSTRWISDAGLSNGVIGPEAFMFNSSPLTGRWSAWCESGSVWGYCVIHNAVTAVPYLAAWRTTRAEDPFGGGARIHYFPLAQLDDVSAVMQAIGTFGGRTLPTVVLGRGSDMSWFPEGRRDNFPDDTSYTYAASGTAFLTGAKMPPGFWGHVDWVRVKVAGLTTSETVTVAIRPTAGAAYTTIGAAMKDNGTGGQHVLYANQPGDLYGDEIKPQITLARGGTTTLSPKVLELSVGLRIMPATPGGRAIPGLDGIRI